MQLLSMLLAMLPREPPIDNPPNPATLPVDSFVFFFDRYGLPLGFLGILVWACIRGAKWFAPRLDRLINRHESLLDALQVELRQHSGFLQKHSAILDKLQENQEQVLDCLQEMRRAAELSAVAAERVTQAAATLRVEREGHAGR